MKSKSGFTLIEMMVVIAIMAIITAIATPNVMQWVGTQRFNSAVRDIQSSIESMRLYAVKENSTTTISFTNGANSYVTTTRKRGLPSTDPDAVKNTTHNLPHGVTVSPTMNLVFSSLGTAPTFGTVTINGPSGLSLDIAVAITGSSRIL